MSDQAATFRNSRLWAPSSIALCCCRPQTLLRAQSSGPQVEIDAPVSNPAVISRAASFLDQLLISTPVSWPRKVVARGKIYKIVDGIMPNSIRLQAWMSCPQPLEKYLS